MPPKKAKDEIEVAFGLKQVLMLLVFSGVVVGGAYFWGYETGHRRALRGEPSLLSFLEKTADPYTEPVSIPKVLLEDVDDNAGQVAKPAIKKEAPPLSGDTVGDSSAPSGSERAEVTRVKPRPAVKREPPEDKPAPVSVSVPRQESAPAQPVAAPVPAAAPSGQGIHYQVAALGVRKNAKALVDWLRSEGFAAQILPANNQGLYRVYVGPFRTDADAASAKDRLTKDGFKPMMRKF